MDAALLKMIIADQKQALEKRLERNIIDRDVPDLQRFINAPNVLAAWERSWTFHRNRLQSALSGSVLSS